MGTNLPHSHPSAPSSAPPAILIDSEHQQNNHNGGDQAMAREYRKGNWTLTETMVLITAKKLDDERRMNGGDREKNKTAELRWKWIENYCWKNGCFRSHNQCNDKWDNLLRDYKKVRDYELRLLPGQPSYWHLEKHERKEKMLPSNLLLEIFEALRDVVDKRYPPRLLQASASPPPPTTNSSRHALLASPAVPSLAVLQDNHHQQQFSQQHHRSAIHFGHASFHPRSQQPHSGDSMEMDSSESESETPHSPAKRRRKMYKGESSSGRGLAPAMSKSTSELTQTLLACEKKRDKRHKELLGVQERKLHIEERRTEISRQGVAGLIEAVNKLADAILTLASDKNISTTD